MSKIKEILSNILNNTLTLKKNLITPVAIISFVSLILLVFFSPVYSILWLVVSSFYFLYLKSYKSIYKIWFITITIWYLIFTTTLSEIPILIGPEHTKLILIYLIQNDVLFANLCFQTVVILDILSRKLGFPIYIPAFINFIKMLIDFLKPKPTNCAPKEDLSSSQQKSEKEFSLWFFLGSY